jgi:ABC-2 type transport system permease protein
MTSETVGAGKQPVARSSRSAVEWRVIWAFWKREVLRYWRDKSQLFGGFSRTVLWLIILGFGLGAALRQVEGYTYAQYIMPGVITLNVLFASLQCAIALVWDREVGLLREVLVSPAPMLSVSFGKILGGATISVVQGSIPLLFAPVIGVDLTIRSVLLAWSVMFGMGITLTAFGVIVASRMKTFEGFGSISNGIIQPLYFLSGSIFPIKGIIGGVGFLDIPDPLRQQLREYGVYAIGGGWVVQLPVWLRVLVYSNPISYQLDLLRAALLDFRQLPLVAGILVTTLLPLIMAGLASYAMTRMYKRG